MELLDSSSSFCRELPWHESPQKHPSALDPRRFPSPHPRRRRLPKSSQTLCNRLSSMSSQRLVAYPQPSPPWQHRGPRFGHVRSFRSARSTRLDLHRRISLRPPQRPSSAAGYPRKTPSRKMRTRFSRGPSWCQYPGVRQFAPPEPPAVNLFAGWFAFRPTSFPAPVPIAEPAGMTTVSRCRLLVQKAA